MGDTRGKELNFIKTDGGFRNKCQSFADDLLNWGPPNVATGASYAVSTGCDATKNTLESWKECYKIMQSSLDNVYMPGAQKFIENNLLKQRNRFYRYVTDPMDWMLSSMNAGPQVSSLAGASVASQTVFLAPSAMFKRTVMLLTAGGQVSVSVMGPAGGTLTTMVYHELNKIIALAA